MEKLKTSETPLESFKKVLFRSWSRGTAYPGDQERWSYENPALGQCVVSLLVLMDYFPGGKILRSSRHHHYAYLFRGKIVDPTREQFGEGVEIEFDGERTREYLLESEAAVAALTADRYMELLKRVRDIIGDPDEFWFRVDPLGLYLDPGNPFDEMHQAPYSTEIPRVEAIDGGDGMDLIG